MSTFTHWSSAAKETLETITELYFNSGGVNFDHSSGRLQNYAKGLAQSKVTKYEKGAMHFKI